MNYRLGLDMGTDSLGWAVIELSEKKEPINVVDMGVRIFEGGRNPKTFESLAVERRMARGTRRMRDRKNNRKKAILFSLIEEGLMPEDEKERKSMKNIDPYVLRHEALDRKLTEHELGRALFHLGTRRGFKSNRIEEKNAESKSQAAKISNLSRSMEIVGARTIGEFLWIRIKNGQEARFRGSFDCYPSRQHYEDEFEAIKKAQVLYHDVDWDKIHDAIFFQRPLKAQEKGRCRYYLNEYRAYAALPSSHRFRILTEINNLKVEMPNGNSVSLNNAEKDKLAKALDNHATMNFNSIRKLLGFDSECKFNIEDEKRSGLKGNETSAKMRKPENFGSLWDTLTPEKQDEVTEVLIVSETDEEGAKSLESFNLTEAQKASILSLVFSKNMTMLSSKFMRECSSVMEKEHCGYSDAVSKMGFDHSNREYNDCDCLPYYGEVLADSVVGAHPEATEREDQYRFGKISNPTVHIALNQLKKLVNALIDRYGKPAQIVVELSRDIADGKEKRNETKKKQAKEQKENERIEQEIKNITHYPNVTRTDIKKFKLWEELGKDPSNRRCPYCGEIISDSQLFSKEIEIEHILPYSRTLLDSMSNLTVAHVSCNDFKGNKSPYEAFSSSPDKYDWESMVKRSKSLPNGKGAKFLAGAMEKFESESSFLNNQLNDGRYIARATKEYLNCICSDIWTVNGRNTAHLRSQWGLNRLLNKDSGNNSKNRNDHRHHSIDALVIGLTDRKVVKAMADLNVNTSHAERFMVPPFPCDLYTVEGLLRNMIVSHRMDHGHTGRMFKDTAAGLRMIPKTIALKKIAETVYKEDRILDKDISERFDSLLKNGKGFVAARNVLVKEFENRQVTIVEPVWVTTVNIIDLTNADILKDRIFDPNLRAFIRTKTKDVINDKTELRKRLQEISSDLHGYRRVKYIPYSQSFTPIDSVKNKGYERDSINFVIIWAIPKKGKDPSCQGQFVSYQEVANNKFKDEKPHPAAKKIATIYKNDILYIKPKDRTGGYYALVAGYSTKANQIDIRPLNASGSIKEWKDSVSLDSVPDYSQWENSRNAEQNFKSINVLFSENHIRTVRVSPDGKIRR